MEMTKGNLSRRLRDLSISGSPPAAPIHYPASEVFLLKSRYASTNKYPYPTMLHWEACSGGLCELHLRSLVGRPFLSCCETLGFEFYALESENWKDSILVYRSLSDDKPVLIQSRKPPPIRTVASLTCYWEAK